MFHGPNVPLTWISPAGFQFDSRASNAAARSKPKSVITRSWISNTRGSLVGSSVSIWSREARDVIVSMRIGDRSDSGWRAVSSSWTVAPAPSCRGFVSPSFGSDEPGAAEAAGRDADLEAFEIDRLQVQLLEDQAGDRRRWPRTT